MTVVEFQLLEELEKNPTRNGYFAGARTSVPVAHMVGNVAIHVSVRMVLCVTMLMAPVTARLAGW